MGREAVIEAVRIRGQHVAFLVGQELLDRIGLLDVCHVPVTDPFPRRVRVTAEDQLAPSSVNLQELRAVGMAPERRVDYQARSDPVPSVDNLCLAGEDLAFDFRQRLWRISANRGSCTGLGGRR